MTKGHLSGLPASTRLTSQLRNLGCPKGETPPSERVRWILGITFQGWNQNKDETPDLERLWSQALGPPG